MSGASVSSTRRPAAARQPAQLQARSNVTCAAAELEAQVDGPGLLQAPLKAWAMPPTAPLAQRPQQRVERRRTCRITGKPWRRASCQLQRHGMVPGVSLCRQLRGTKWSSPISPTATRRGRSCAVPARRPRASPRPAALPREQGVNAQRVAVCRAGAPARTGNQSGRPPRRATQCAAVRRAGLTRPASVGVKLRRVRWQWVSIQPAWRDDADGAPPAARYRVWAPFPLQRYRCYRCAGPCSTASSARSPPDRQRLRLSQPKRPAGSSPHRRWTASQPATVAAGRMPAA